MSRGSALGCEKDTEDSRKKQLLNKALKDMEVFLSLYPREMFNRCLRMGWGPGRNHSGNKPSRVEELCNCKRVALYLSVVVLLQCE